MTDGERMNVHMKPAVNWRIYQRNQEGYADVLLAGTLPEGEFKNARVHSRVLREQDNLTIIPWTDGELNGRSWQIMLKLPQGGLYRLETSVIYDGGERRIQLIAHVGVGELFMLTGQSNMAGYGREMAYDPPELGVHLFGNDGEWKLAVHPLNDSIDTQYPENTEYNSGVSPMLSFARQVRAALNVPVGLVQASLGGSPLSAWHEEENGVLTSAMYRRLDETGPVGGIVWYQGCSDANENDAPGYLERFTRTVELWRRKMGNVPVVTVQLNRWTRWNAPEEHDRWWGMIREAQRQAARTIPGVYIAPAIDLPASDGIHNSSGANVILGERLAHVYLRGHWGLPGAFAPDVEEVVRVDDTHLFARYTEGSCVMTMDDTPWGMDAEDDDGLIPCTKVSAKDDGLLFELSRPCGENVRLHVLWRANPPSFQPRSSFGMPILSCYGVPAVRKA